MAQIDWIALDWGTTQLRAFAMSDGGESLHRASSDDGMSRLSRNGFEPAMLSLIGGWLGADAMPVVAAGMVGARQGWCEAPYAEVPCGPVDPAGFITVPGTDPRIAVTIIPGLCQPHPADVMRGEETQIAGFLKQDPGFDGVLCLPGTHTKWARVSAGEIVGFRTFMTGEMFATLATHSVLRHSVDHGWDDGAFAKAVRDGLSHPEMIAARLFSLRAEDILTGAAKGSARARLSGLLIGAELAAARSWWLGQRVALIGADTLVAHYRIALDQQGVDAPAFSGDDMVLAGLVAARAMMGGRS